MQQALEHSLRGRRGEARIPLTRHSDFRELQRSSSSLFPSLSLFLLFFFIIQHPDDDDDALMCSFCQVYGYARAHMHIKMGMADPNVLLGEKTRKGENEESPRSKPIFQRYFLSTLLHERLGALFLRLIKVANKNL